MKADTLIGIKHLIVLDLLSAEFGAVFEGFTYAGVYKSMLFWPHPLINFVLGAFFLLLPSIISTHTQ